MVLFAWAKNCGTAHHTVTKANRSTSTTLLAPWRYRKWNWKWKWCSVEATNSTKTQKYISAKWWSGCVLWKMINIAQLLLLPFSRLARLVLLAVFGVVRVCVCIGDGVRWMPYNISIDLYFTSIELNGYRFVASFVYYSISFDRTLFKQQRSNNLPTIEHHNLGINSLLRLSIIIGCTTSRNSTKNEYSMLLFVASCTKGERTNNSTQSVFYPMRRIVFIVEKSSNHPAVIIIMIAANSFSRK